MRHCAAEAKPHESPRFPALIGPLRHVYGPSDKILTMTLSTLLMAATDSKPGWFEIGKGMIAVDTLVHNFLHRTGVLADFGAPHAYGLGCYASCGCADIIRSISAEIDATASTAAFQGIFRGSAPFGIMIKLTQFVLRFQIPFLGLAACGIEVRGWRHRIGIFEVFQILSRQARIDFKTPMNAPTAIIATT